MLYRILVRSGFECVSVSLSFVTPELLTPINRLYLQVCIRFSLHILILFILSLYIEHQSVHTTWPYWDFVKVFAVALYFFHFLKHLSFDIILCLAFSCRTSPVQTFPPLLITFVIFSLCLENLFVTFIIQLGLLLLLLLLQLPILFPPNRIYCWSYNRQRRWNSDFPIILYIWQCLQPKPRYDKCKFHNFSSGFAHKMKLLTRFLQIVSSFAGHRAFPPWLCARMDQSIQWRDVCCPMIYSYRG